MYSLNALKYLKALPKFTVAHAAIAKNESQYWHSTITLSPFYAESSLVRAIFDEYA